MNFKKSLTPIKEVVSSKQTKAELHRSIKELLNSWRQKNSNFQSLCKKVNPIVEECLIFRRAGNRKRLISEMSDIIYRTYYQEGGLYSLFDSIVEYAEYRLDDFTDIETLFLSIYNGRVDMTIYQLKKMKEKLGHMDQELRDLEANQWGDGVDNIKDSERIQFLQEIGWQNDDKKLDEIHKKLKQIFDEIDTADKEAINRLRQKLRLVSNELDEVDPLRNWEKLKRVHQSLFKGQEETDEVSYSTLLEAIESVLDREETKRLASIEGVSLEIYKEWVVKAAEVIQKNLLDTWHKD